MTGRIYNPRTETYYADDGRIFTRQQMIWRGGLEESIVSIPSTMATWNRNIALAESATGYIECPTHGVVDETPCPICSKRPCSSRGAPDIVFEVKGFIVCTNCHGALGDHYFVWRHRNTIAMPDQCICIACAEKYELEYVWDELTQENAPMPIAQISEFTIAKQLALREHGCIQEPGSNPAVAMDGLASFIRRRVLPDIKAKKQSPCR